MKKEKELRINKIKSTFNVYDWYWSSNSRRCCNCDSTEEKLTKGSKADSTAMALLQLLGWYEDVACQSTPKSHPPPAGTLTIPAFASSDPMP